MTTLALNFHFIRPAALLLLPLVLGVWWLWKRRSDPLNGWRQQIDPELLAALVVGRNATTRTAVRLQLACWLIAGIAVAGPTWRLEPSPFADDATPLMILLKADISMDVADPAPSRLERARLEIADLAAARAGQPLGLIAYAGSAHLVLPPTRDTKAVVQMAREVSSEVMPKPGDRLDLALLEAVRILTAGGRGGSVVVLADTVDTDLDLLREVKSEVPYRIQFLAINAPDSSQNDALRAAAGTLSAKVERLEAGDGDIAAIVRRAASAPIAQSGESGGRWQEAGYWLVPLVGLLVLLTFRRERSEEVRS